MSETWLKTRRRLIGVVFIAMLGLLIALSIAIYNKTFTSATMVTLYTDAAGNEMNLNADVMVNGVVVGYVKSIASDGSNAELGLAITPSVASTLPANVTAQLLPTTLFGVRYVDLVTPAQPSAQTLADTRVIEQDRSADAIELQKVLNDLYPMLTAVQPAKLSVTLSAVADALTGNGTKLGQTLDTLNSYLKQFNPQLPALDADIRELVQVTRAYAQASPGIVQALQDFTVTSKTIAAEASNLTTLYSTVTAASQNLDTFLTANQQDIIRLSVNGEPTLNTLARYSAEFPCVFQDLTEFEANMNRVLGAGTDQPGIHVTLHVVEPMGAYLPVKNAPVYGDNAGATCYGAPFSGIKLNDGTGGGTDAPAATVSPVPVPSNTATPTATPTTSPTPTATAKPTTSPSAGTTSPTPTATPSAGTSTNTGSPAPSGTVTAAGLGPANSAAENELINELISPSVNVPPDDLPSWSSVLLGPLFRGTTVSVG